MKLFTVVLVFGFLVNQSLLAIDDEGNSESFHEAAWRGDVAYFKEHLLDKVAAQRKDCDNLTPLDWAVKGEYEKIVQVLGVFFTAEEVEASLVAHTMPKQQYGPVCPDAPGRRGFSLRNKKRQLDDTTSPLTSTDERGTDSFADVDHP